MTPSRFIFEYDPRKAASNLRKHGVSFDEAMTAFSDPLSSTLLDDEHSEAEKRFITVGMSSRQRLLFIVYTENHLWYPAHRRPCCHRSREKAI